jgi:hypothetical protein
MPISARDREILRGLSGQVAEIAALPVQQETIALWKALNGLSPVRPMVMVDQIPWHEMDVNGELALQTEDALCRHYETSFRRTLYAWKHMRADMVVEPVVDVDRVIRSSGFGIDIVENRAVTDPNNDVVGHYYIDQIKTDRAGFRVLEKTEHSISRRDDVGSASREGGPEGDTGLLRAPRLSSGTDSQGHQHGAL